MERQRIEAAAKLAGLELDAATNIVVAGDDPVLDSPFHIGEGAATALALVGQEASRVWQLRGNSPQSLSIDIRHAAESMRSYQHVDLVEQTAEPLPLEDPLLAIYRCGDGRFIYLHRSMADTARMLDSLDLKSDATAEDVARVTASIGAFELEDKLAAQGLCSAVCRTHEEWLAHPQGELLATKPVVEVTRIGDSPPEPLGDALRPLSDLRVLDLTRILAGPTCARTLAEHGADVLHIASPDLPTLDLFEMDTGHGKRQAFLDLNDESQADTLRDLVRGADVFSQGYRYPSLERRGFGAEELAALRPGLIYVTENAFGHDGPWQGRPGYEQLAQCVTGIAVTQNPQTPALAPAAMNDYTTGYFAAMGAMIALRRRAVEGGSWLVRVSLSQTSMWYYRLGTDLSPNEADESSDIGPFVEERDTGYGRMHHLSPALHMSETEPAWQLPTAPLGSGTAHWS